MELLKTNVGGQWEILSKSDEPSDKMGNTQNQLGITDEKKKQKFRPDMTEQELKKYVKKHADHMCDTGYVAGKAKDWTWHYDPKFPIEKLESIKKSRELWKAWFVGEMVEWKHDHGDERKGHFEEWAKHPEKKPIVIIEGSDGELHQVDGHHRTAMAIIKDMDAIPVIYGTRKTE